MISPRVFHRCHGTFLAVFLLLPLAQAQTIDVQELRLDNGLKVLMVEDHSVPSICFSIAFRVGSRNEHAGITGISHLFEHMMFNGSGKYPPGEFDRILENGGGYSNAYTSNDITFYYEEFNPDLLETVLDMEGDRMRSLKIDSANLEQERGIVKEERRVSTDNDVRSKMLEDLYAAAFVAHPYHNPVVGWMGDLDNITVQDAQKYFSTYYAPNNATVVLVGAFHANDMLPMMERYFGSIPAQPAPRSVEWTEPNQLGERRVSLHKAAELPAVVIGYKAAGVGSPDYYPLKILATVLSRGQSSRLYTSLVYDLQLATGVGAGVDEFIDAGLFVVYVQMQEGKSVDEAEREVYRIIDGIGKNGVLETELQKARNTAQADYVAEFKTNVGVAGRLGYFDVVYGDYTKSSEVLGRYDAVTVADVRRVAASYLTDKDRTVVVLIPEKSTDTNAATR